MAAVGCPTSSEPGLLRQHGQSCLDFKATLVHINDQRQRVGDSFTAVCNLVLSFL